MLVPPVGAMGVPDPCQPLIAATCLTLYRHIGIGQCRKCPPRKAGMRGEARLRQGDGGRTRGTTACSAERQRRTGSCGAQNGNLGTGDLRRADEPYGSMATAAALEMRPHARRFGSVRGREKRSSAPSHRPLHARDPSIPAPEIRSLSRTFRPLRARNPSIPAPEIRSLSPTIRSLYARFRASKSATSVREKRARPAWGTERPCRPCLPISSPSQCRSRPARRGRIVEEARRRPYTRPKVVTRVRHMPRKGCRLMSAQDAACAMRTPSSASGVRSLGGRRCVQHLVTSGACFACSWRLPAER